MIPQLRNDVHKYIMSGVNVVASEGMSAVAQVPNPLPRQLRELRVVGEDL